MNLVSLTCSGDSLEKAVVLSKLAARTAPSFYGDFETVHVFYGENIPKQRPPEVAHGTLGGMIGWIGRREARLLPYRHVGDVFDDREFLLNQLKMAGRIPDRVAERLLADPVRCLRTLLCSPWHLMLLDLRDALLREAETVLPNFRFIPLDLRREPRVMLESFPPYAPAAKIYTLNPDGVVSSGVVGGDVGRRRDSIEARISSSIACSGNVFVFIAEVLRGVESLVPSPVIGYRPMTNTPRPSYNAAIGLAQNRGAATLIEPQNLEFRAAWAATANVPETNKPSAAVYLALKRDFFGRGIER